MTNVESHDRIVKALAKGCFMKTEPHTVGSFRGRQLVIGFANPDHADDAMEAIGKVLKEIRLRYEENLLCAKMNGPETEVSENVNRLIAAVREAWEKAVQDPTFDQDDVQALNKTLEVFSSQLRYEGEPPRKVL